jgi:hypothetical protein
MGQRGSRVRVWRYCCHRLHANISCHLSHRKKGNPSLIRWISNLSSLTHFSLEKIFFNLSPLTPLLPTIYYIPATQIIYNQSLHQKKVRINLFVENVQFSHLSHSILISCHHSSVGSPTLIRVHLQKNQQSTKVNHKTTQQSTNVDQEILKWFNSIMGLTNRCDILHSWQILLICINI